MWPPAFAGGARGAHLLAELAVEELRPAAGGVRETGSVRQARRRW